MRLRQFAGLATLPLLLGTAALRGTPPAPRPARAADVPDRYRLYLPALRQGIAYDGAVDFAVIGDYGWCAMGGPDACLPEQRVAAMVAGWRPQLVVTTGDNNYPRGKSDTWDENTAPYRAYIPDRFEPAVGNHDYICSQCPDLPFRSQFQRELTRELAKPDESNPLLRLFFVDSNAADPDPNTVVKAKAAGRSPLEVQRRWLQAGLTGAAACWKLVLLHHAPYSSTANPGPNSLLQSTAGWNYRQWGADVVFAGHAHNYERITRPGGFAYIVNGAGGAPQDPFLDPPVLGSVARVNGFGAIRGHADAKQLMLDFYTVDPAAPDAPPALRDSHRVERDCNGAAASAGPG